jgi:hypothetical protein
LALITEKFWEQSQFIARSGGISDLPRLMLPYPIAGQPDPVIADIAQKYAGAMLAMLRATPSPDGE